MSDFIEHLAEKVVTRGFGVAAIFVLESFRPLTLVGQQFLIFCHPIVRVFIGVEEMPKFIELLDDRNNLEELICAIEARLEGDA